MRTEARGRHADGLKVGEFVELRGGVYRIRKRTAKDLHLRLEPMTEAEREHVRKFTGEGEITEGEGGKNDAV